MNARVSDSSARRLLFRRGSLAGIFAVALVAVMSLPTASAAARRYVESARQAPNSNFTIGKPNSNPVTSLLAPDGTAYLLYIASRIQGAVSYPYVCVLPRGARSCPEPLHCRC